MAAITSAYNHYLSTYASKNITRYDSHKKSELRSIYNAIVKLNKESPLYLTNFSDSTRSYAINIKESSRNLKNVINDLTNGDTSHLFTKKIASSDNEDVVSAKYIGDASSSDLSDLTIEVQKLATPQINQGRYVDSYNLGLSPNTYSFDVGINDLEYEFQFSVSENDTNLSVQEKLVHLINKSDIGLEASISTNENRQSALTITSKNTGAPEGRNTLFNISDANTSMASGSVDYLGFGTIMQYPENASFLLNGSVQSESSSNTFTVGKSFELSLKDLSASGHPVNIGLKADTDAVTEHIVTFANEYNSFLDMADTYSTSNPRSNKLVREYSKVAKEYKNTLESAGLNILENGHISIDTGLLTQATQDAASYSENLERINGFKDAILAKTNQTFLNPMEYVDKVMVSYKNPGKNFASPYVTSIYSGMMFNGYC